MEILSIITLFFALITVILFIGFCATENTKGNWQPGFALFFIAFAMLTFVFGSLTAWLYLYKSGFFARWGL